jgi:hypothetical protein
LCKLFHHVNVTNSDLDWSENTCDEWCKHTKPEASTEHDDWEGNSPDSVADLEELDSAIAICIGR